tara:strand:+ start:287 stop:499 length:213 start_codon:yes stop_codon:yes gene_type:complete
MGLVFKDSKGNEIKHPNAINSNTDNNTTDKPTTELQPQVSWDLMAEISELKNEKMLLEHKLDTLKKIIND